LTLQLTRFCLGSLLIISVLARLITPGISEAFSSQATDWLEAMNATGYMPILLMGTEFLVGIALITGRFVPLALVVFAPININIFLLHALLDPHPVRLIQIVFMSAAHLYLVWGYWDIFRPIVFSPRQETLLQWRQPSSVTVILVIRTLLGGLFLVTGMAKLLGLVGTQSAFITAMQETGYLYTLLGIVEAVIGGLLISGVAVPLALIMLTPILLNILAYHALLDRTSPLIVIVVGAVLATLWLAKTYYVLYRPLLLSRSDHVSEKRHQNT